MCCVTWYVQYNILMLLHKVLFHSKILSQKQIIYIIVQGKASTTEHKITIPSFQKFYTY